MEEIYYPDKPPKEPPKTCLGEERNRMNSQIGLWLTHDPAIFRDTESGFYYIYCTGAVCQRSYDLIHWEMIGKVINEPPKESSEWVGGKAIWAPDIVKVGQEYRLYCSNSTWGVRQSCIFLAISDNPEGPFQPRGCVLKTNDSMPVNAIDANIITDTRTGEMYMVYGSFWGGCYVLHLDKETGLAAEQGIGKCVACRPAWMSGAIEGPYMVYNRDTDYYYLFVSYGSLKSDYNIRVGRSKSILGPFTDYHGRKMTDLEDDDNTVGFLVMCGYRWNDGTAYMAPGHNSVLQDEDGQWYLVFHIREQNYSDEPEPSTLQIRKMYWNELGWPVVSAQPYSGEKKQLIPISLLIGRYECIHLTPSLPQSVKESVPMKLERDGCFECCSIKGTWQYEAERLHIYYGTHHEICHVCTSWDRELYKPTVIFMGVTEMGITVWGKRIEVT